MISVKEATTKALTNWKSKLAYTLLSLFIVFLMKFWLDSYAESNAELKTSNTELKVALNSNTTAIGSLNASINTLRLNTGHQDEKLIDKLKDNKEMLKDHEARIRELERNR